MKNKPTDAYDNTDKPEVIMDGLNQQTAQQAWTKLQKQKRTKDQSIQGSHNKFYCIKNYEDISRSHFNIEVFPPGSDPNKLDPRFGFTLIRTGKGKFKVIPPGTTYEGEEFELNAREINSMLAEIASGTREVCEETTVDGIKAGTRRKVAKI